MKNDILSKIKNDLKEIEYSIYPILSQFIHQNKKIDEYAVNKLYESLTLFKDHVAKELVFKGEDVKYIHYIYHIFDNLGEFLKKVFKIAKARDRFDSRNSLLNTINSLKEFAYFTSAVTLGVIVTTLHLDTEQTLGILGIIGLFIYFLDDILTLRKQIKLENTGYQIRYEYKEIKKIINDLERLDENEQRTKIKELERILISPQPSDVLDYIQVIELKHLYFHFIKGKYIYYVRNDKDANPTIKAIFEMINKFVENISQIIVFSLVAVDSNRPLIKKKGLWERIKNVKAVIKFVGYVMLNAISYNLFYTYLVDDVAVVFILAVIILVGFLLLTIRFEEFMVKELTKSTAD